MKLARVLAIVLLAGLCGCQIVLRNYQAAGPRLWPPRARTPEVALTVRVYGSGRYDTAPADVSPASLQMWHDEAVRAYHESGAFASVSGGWAPDTWVAEVAFSVRERTSGSWQLRSPLTPRRGGADLRMRTRFRDPQGQVIGVIRKSESLRLYSFFSPRPLAIGHKTSGIIRRAVRDLHRATVAEAVERGLFRTPE